MKKIIVALTVAALTFGAFAFPRGPRPAFRPHHHGHHGWVAPVAFGVGAVVGAVVSTVAAPQPVRVWVPGYWTTRFDVYGRPCQVWVPGHWEWR